MADPYKRDEGVRKLVQIAIFEVVLLAAVMTVYLYTDRISYLIGGVIGVMLISGPMFLRWFRAYGDALGGSDHAGRK